MHLYRKDVYINQFAAAGKVLGENKSAAVQLQLQPCVKKVMCDKIKKTVSTMWKPPLVNCFFKFVLNIALYGKIVNKKTKSIYKRTILKLYEKKYIIFEKPLEKKQIVGYTKRAVT